MSRAALKQKGLDDTDLAKIESALPGVFELSLAFAPWVLGKETYERLGVTPEKMSKPALRLRSSTSASHAKREIEGGETT